MKKLIKNLGTVVLSVIVMLLLVACSNSKNNDITGTWLANHSYGELELVVVENEFELSLNYTKQGWFNSSDETMILMRGQVKLSSKKLEVESVTSEFLEIIGDEDSEELNPEDIKITYTKSGTSLTLNMDGSEVTFDKSIKGETNNEK